MLLAQNAEYYSTNKIYFAGLALNEICCRSEMYCSAIFVTVSIL